MKWLRLMVVCYCVVLMLPASAQAARQDDVGCTFAQLPLVGWLSGLTTARRTVVIDGVALNLTICAPSHESYTAEQMLGLLAESLPYLSAHAGVPLHGSKERLMVMVDKEKLMPFADGQLTEGENVIEIHPRSQDWTVVHEGAHYWANSENFQEPWMVEGYAEYLTERAMIDRGSSQRAEPPAPICNHTPLRTWYNSGLNFCGYTAGAAVFRDLSQAVGEDVFMKTLHMLATSGGVDSERLLVTLEQATRKDLLATMRPVFSPDEYEARKQTRELTQALIKAKARGQALQINLPNTIGQAINTGNLQFAQQWLTALDTLFSASETLIQRCNALELQCNPIWQALPEDVRRMPELQRTISDQSALLDRFALLRQQAQAARLVVPAELVREVQGFAHDAAKDIHIANTSLATGLKLEEQCAPFNAPCSDPWRALWSTGDFHNVERIITDTAEVLGDAQHVEQRCSDFLESCRQLWRGALKQGQPADAKGTLLSLEHALDGLDSLQQRCGDVGDMCRKTWASAFAHDSFAGARQAQAEIKNLLARDQALQERCGDDWPCRVSWQATYRQTGDIGAAAKRIEDIGKELSAFQAAARIVAATAGDNAARDRDTPLVQAQQALADGQLDQASTLAQGIIMAQRRREQMAQAIPIASGVGLLAGVGILMILFARSIRQRKQPARQRPAQNKDMELLASLLAQPPRSGRPHR